MQRLIILGNLFGIDTEAIQYAHRLSLRRNRLGKHRTVPRDNVTGATLDIMLFQQPSFIRPFADTSLDPISISRAVYLCAQFFAYRTKRQSLWLFSRRFRIAR